MGRRGRERVVKVKMISVLLILAVLSGCSQAGVEHSLEQAEQGTLAGQSSIGLTDSEAADIPAIPEGVGAGGAVSEDGLTGMDERPEAESASEWYGRYFRKGDFSWQMEIYPEGAFERDKLSMEVWEKEQDGFHRVHKLSVPYEPEVSEYESLEMDDDGSVSALPVFSIRLQEDGSVLLSGRPVSEGIYYPMKSLLKPKVFTKPLYESSLQGMDREELRLLRNQFYAVYGYPFGAEDLREYFESRPWYERKATYEVRAEAGQEIDFHDGVFNGLEKRNIEALKAAEEGYDEERLSTWRAVWKELPLAPYMQFLSENMEELSVDLQAGESGAEDKGIYYEVQGRICLPVTLEPAEIEALKNGAAIEVCLNELTGETGILKGTEEEGAYLLSYDADGQEISGECYGSYHYENDCYTIWENSADTIFKTVYEGPIYVLKGARTEWYQYFGLTEGEGIAASQELTFDKDTSYWGNVPDFDEKGYLRALYFYGD